MLCMSYVRLLNIIDNFINTYFVIIIFHRKYKDIRVFNFSLLIILFFKIKFSVHYDFPFDI